LMHSGVPLAKSWKGSFSSMVAIGTLCTGPHQNVSNWQFDAVF